MKLVQIVTGTRGVLEREVVRIIQQRAPQTFYIPQGLIPNDGTLGYLNFGYYSGFKTLVKSCEFHGRRVVTYCRDHENKFCAVVQNHDGRLFRYTVNLDRQCIEFRGLHFTPPVQVVRQVTVQRTRWL